MKKKDKTRANILMAIKRLKVRNKKITLANISSIAGMTLETLRGHKEYIMDNSDLVIKVKGARVERETTKKQREKLMEFMSHSDKALGIGLKEYRKGP